MKLTFRKPRLIRSYCIVFSVFAAMLYLQATGTAQVGSEKLEHVTLCQLMAKPDGYVGKTVRLSAIFKNLVSNESILTSTCDGKPESVATTDMEDDGEGRFVSIRTNMNSQLTSKADVIVVGRLIGPRDKDSDYGYGHMGWSKYQFEISNLVKLSPVVEQKSPKKN